MRHILVTGGANGIGKEIVKSLLANKHTVSVTDYDDHALNSMTSDLSKNEANRLHRIRSDLSTADGCIAAVDEAVSKASILDGVINNVGIGVSSIRDDAERNHPKISEITIETWERFFFINVHTAMIITQRILPKMLARRWGRIINITTSYRTMLRVLPYGATKSALESASSIWAKELVGTGVTVNVLVPGGLTDTQLVGLGSGWPRHELLSPAIMGPPAAWLISNDANGVTGRRITASDWDTSKPPKEALSGSSREIGWPELALSARPWQQPS